MLAGQQLAQAQQRALVSSAASTLSSLAGSVRQPTVSNGLSRHRPLKADRGSSSMTTASSSSSSSPAASSPLTSLLSASVAASSSSSSSRSRAVSASPTRSSRSRREIRPRRESDRFSCGGRCGMQFSTADEFISHYQRVHHNNRDIAKRSQRLRQQHSSAATHDKVEEMEDDSDAEEEEDEEAAADGLRSEQEEEEGEPGSSGEQAADADAGDGSPVRGDESAARPHAPSKAAGVVLPAPRRSGPAPYLARDMPWKRAPPASPRTMKRREEARTAYKKRRARLQAVADELKRRKQRHSEDAAASSGGEQDGKDDGKQDDAGSRSLSDSLPSPMDDDFSSSDEMQGGKEFERFGRAAASSSSPSLSSSSSSGSDSGSSSSRRRSGSDSDSASSSSSYSAEEQQQQEQQTTRARRLSARASRRRPQRTRPVSTTSASYASFSSSSRPAASSLPDESAPVITSPSASLARADVEKRARMLRNYHYLLKWRFPPSVPHQQLLCFLCQQGMVGSELGLLMRCWGGCGLCFHQSCIQMETVPSGPWYCCEDCDSLSRQHEQRTLVARRQAAAVQGAGQDEAEDDDWTRGMDDLVFMRIARRWKNWFERRVKRGQKQAAAGKAEAGVKPASRRRKPETEEDDGAAGNRQRFIIRTVVAIPSSSLYPPSQSRWADAFPCRPLPPTPSVRRIYRPLSLTASGETVVPAANEASSHAPFSDPSLTPTDQLPAASPAAASSPASRAAERVQAARPRRHLMFSLKQPRCDPADFVPQHPAHHLQHAAKGPTLVASSRSLRGSHSSLRSASFLLSLRVPVRGDPNLAICCVCEDGDSVEENPIILCDGPCRMAYHRYCVGLSKIPRAEEEWVCSDVCRRAKARGVGVEDELVVRLVQGRRDEYDERGPYDERGGSESSAALAELFASLDSSYFCPRMAWRLWRKGRWRLQDVSIAACIELMQLLGGLNELEWKVELEGADNSGGDEAAPADAAVAVSAGAGTGESGAAVVELEEDRPWQHQERGGDEQQQSGASTAAASVPSVASLLTHAASCPPALPSSAAPPSPLTEPSPALSPADASPSPFPEASASPSPPPDVVQSEQPRLDRSASTPALPTVPTAEEEEADEVLLAEEDRLLAAYHVQALANNQTKSRLLSTLQRHAVISPASLPTLSERQREEEAVLRTYLEYEEKHNVGSEKDRARRAERCHVNPCRCSSCFNAHLLDRQQGDDDDADDGQMDDDAATEAVDDGQPDALLDDDDDVRADEPQQAVSLSSSASFTLPRAPPPLSGSFHPAAILRHVACSLRRKQRALTLAKSVGGADLAQLLEAGSKGGRTLTRGQMTKAKQQKEGADDGELAAAGRTAAEAGGELHLTRRRSAVRSEDGAESSSAKASFEVKSLSPWGWDRGWTQRDGQFVRVPQQQQQSAHMTRRSLAAARGGEAELRAAGDGRSVLPRGHVRLRVLHAGKDVFEQRRRGQVPSSSLPVVRFRPSRSRRRTADSAAAAAAGPLTFRISRQSHELSDGRRRRGGGKVTLRLSLDRDAVLVADIDMRKSSRRRRDRQQQQQHLEGESDGGLALQSSAAAGTRLAVALAAELAEQLHSDARPVETQLEQKLQAAVDGSETTEAASQRASFSAAAVSAERRAKSKPKAKAKPRSQARRELRERQLAELRERPEDMVAVQLQADGSGEVQAAIRVLVDYPWRQASGRRHRHELERLLHTFPSDSALPLPAADAGQSGEAAEGDEQLSATESRRRSVRSRRSTLAAAQSVPDTALAQTQQQQQQEASSSSSSSSSRYGLDHNGLPVIVQPIADDICRLCGLAGELFLCDSVLDGVQCSNCYHADCAGLTRKPKTFICAAHSCRSCSLQGRRRRDDRVQHQPFSYCEWCDKSWCRSCGEEAEAAAQFILWQPRRPRGARRFVVCSECVDWGKDELGVDFADPARQLLAHEEKVKEQLKLTAELEQGEGELPDLVLDSRLQHEADEQETESDEHPPVKRSKKQQQREQQGEAESEAAEQQTAAAATGDVQSTAAARKRKPAGSRKAGTKRIKSESAKELQDGAHSNGAAVYMNGSSSSGSQPLHLPALTDSDDSLSQPLLSLMPCSTRGDQRSSAAATAEREGAASEQQEEQAAASVGWKLEKDSNGSVRLSRRAADAASLRPPANGLSPISLPSPSSPASTHCLSTSSLTSASTVSSAAASLSPSSPADLHASHPLSLLVHSGVKRTRAARMVEVDGDVAYAKQVQKMLDLETRGRPRHHKTSGAAGTDINRPTG